MENTTKDFEEYKKEIGMILSSAEQLVTSDRLKDYGLPKESFQRIANLWGNLKGVYISPKEVALMMILFKASRLMNNLHHKDSWVDLIGYAAIGATLYGGEA